MISIEELEKLRIANSIIERGNKRLGLRPIYANNISLVEKKNTTLARTQRLKRLTLNQVASQLQQEKKLKQTASNYQPKKLFYKMSAVLGTFIIVYFGFLLFNPSKSTAQLNKAEIVSKEAFLQSDKPLVITTGSFDDKTEAENHMQSLSERLGVPLKILSEKNKFMIQIGPSYENHDDAFLVFDELSQYSIGKLSVRFAD
jgi:hypothetical protein